MNNKTIKKYKDIAALNKEAFLFFNAIKRLTWVKSLIYNNKILLSLEVNDETKETSEWIGFV